MVVLCAYQTLNVIMIVSCEFVLSTQNLNTLHIALCISNAQICLGNSMYLLGSQNHNIGK